MKSPASQSGEASSPRLAAPPPVEASNAPVVTPEAASLDKPKPCRELSGNAKSLIMTSSLFFTITLLQYIASLPRFSNSLALRADCLSMFVDGLSYLGNLAAECNPDEQSKRVVEMAVSGLSLSLLLGFTVYFAVDAIDDIVTAGDKDESVDPHIVLAFAMLGLLFDMLSLFFYAFWNGAQHRGYTPLPSDGDQGKLGTSLSEVAGPRGGVAWLGNINMMSALLHVGSDFLRSLTTLIEATVILNIPTVSSVRADGVSALIVCVIIGVGTLAALLVWIREMQTDLHIHMSPALSKLEAPEYIHLTTHPLDSPHGADEAHKLCQKLGVAPAAVPMAIGAASSAEAQHSPAVAVLHAAPAATQEPGG
uniref:Cation efflux protein transmembrane domain-containing protein n=1 Tax=Rhizochromulina marina TaxID=1034831 RepID=A0A7S2SW32_9STRA|mmetsp:Transcript_9975/g.28357  ORF Transcript_9975/g.28357 Transcript_9975/m.28357 type:complete len:365 (+) Transcript_9975:171-1265(+)